MASRQKITDANSLEDIKNALMKQVTQWFVEQGWYPQAFQKECWKAYTQGLNGMLHAPTGSGKPMRSGGELFRGFSCKKTSNRNTSFMAYLFVLWQ